MITYGQDFFWTKPDGSTMAMSTAGHPTPEAATLSILEYVIALGWTRPKWWQWNRRHDTRLIQ